MLRLALNVSVALDKSLPFYLVSLSDQVVKA